MTTNSRGGSCFHLMEWGGRKICGKLSSVVKISYTHWNQTGFFAVLYSLLQGANFCQLLTKGGSRLFGWFNLSCSSHKLWQGIRRAKVAAICLCVLHMSLTIASSNVKPPDSSTVSHHAVYTCSDIHFQIKFSVILYWLSPECIYVVPLQLCHEALN